MAKPLKELKDSVLVHSMFEGLSCLPDATGSIPFTGVLVAVAMGTRTLTVFGSTDPRGWQPPGAAHRVLTNPIDCHPCDLRQCTVEGHPCLDQLAPAVVASEVEAMLSEGETHG